MIGQEPDMGALAPYHFGHLPVWIDGNAYLNGANVSKHDSHTLVNKRSKVKVELTEDQGEYRLQTNLYKVLKDFTGGIVSSDTLGKAFEPEERFENPDGSDLILDRDYLGDHRSVHPVPGPFAEAVTDLTVWKNAWAGMR